MVIKAWFMRHDYTDPREMNHYTIPRIVPLDYLTSIGVQYIHIPVEGEHQKVMDFAKQHDYTSHDIITINKECLPDYEDKLKCFFTEHLHTDDEVRYTIEGSGYFDVRDKDDQWIRIHVYPGDLLVLPAGIYHRFTVDTANNVKVIRLYMDAPKWKAYNRDEQVDTMQIRHDYLNRTKCR
uniref:Acireductone dioxygenase n=1 Tax=Rhabditophanes sp. KR3021 TaxID=114890 RepID=A0AC35TNX6_9BILA